MVKERVEGEKIVFLLATEVRTKKGEEETGADMTKNHRGGGKR